MTSATVAALKADRSDQAVASEATTGRGRRGSGMLIVRMVVLLLCLLWLVPTVGLLISSFRDKEAVSDSGWWTVIASPLDFSQWTLQNYSDVITGEGMGEAFVNSIVVAVPATVIPIMIAAFAAYAFTFMRFRGRDTVFILVVALLVVPLQIAFVPLLQLFRNFDLVGTFPAVWLAHAGFGMPLAIYILRNYMASLPKSIIESAEVDGASHFQTFWRLIVPMSVPALAAFAIFQFLWVWNDLLVALIFLQNDTPVVTSKLKLLIGDLGQEWHLLTAGAFISMTIPLIVFFSLQRYFVRGLTAGSVKG